MREKNTQTTQTSLADCVSVDGPLPKRKRHMGVIIGCQSFASPDLVPAALQDNP